MPTTAAFAACAFASGAVSVTLGAGDGGSGRHDRRDRRHLLGARIDQSRSPALRPVVLVSRTAVAPAAAAWLRVVFVVAPREKFPELSTAR